MILIGIAFLGHAMMVRFMLNGAAYDAARTCSLQRTPTSACVTGVVKKKLGKTLGWCSSWKAVPKTTKEAGLVAVYSLEVSIDCIYGGIIGSKSYNKSHGLAIGTIKARASMPY